MDSLKQYRELALGSRLARLSERLMKEVQLVYIKTGIDFDPYLFPVFRKVIDQETTTTTAIKDALGITQPAVTQSLQKLFKKRLIEFKSNESDGRSKLISLSAHGETVLKELKPLWAIIEHHVKELTIVNTNNLLEHIEFIEKSLLQKKLSDQILLDYQKMKHQETQVIPFHKKYTKDFKDLNIAWLKKYFVVEPHDEDLLNKCEENIINKGGYIFFTKTGDQISGTVALIKMDNNSFELGKMAVDPMYQGQKIGQKLMQYCIDFAKDKKWTSLVLYSNTKLENAIHIYRKYGFKEMELEKDSPYLRSNIKMELVL